MQPGDALWAASSDAFSLPLEHQTAAADISHLALALPLSAFTPCPFRMSFEQQIHPGINMRLLVVNCLVANFLLYFSNQHPSCAQPDARYLQLDLHICKWAAIHQEVHMAISPCRPGI